VICHVERIAFDVVTLQWPEGVLRGRPDAATAMIRDGACDACAATSVPVLVTNVEPFGEYEPMRLCGSCIASAFAQVARRSKGHSAPPSGTAR
jgi:hypothetical protein